MTARSGQKTSWTRKKTPVCRGGVHTSPFRQLLEAGSQDVGEGGKVLARHVQNCACAQTQAQAKRTGKCHARHQNVDKIGDCKQRVVDDRHGLRNRIVRPHVHNERDQRLVKAGPLEPEHTLVGRQYGGDPVSAHLQELKE
eukprot:6132140-Prymnesium_polylepis.1